MTIDPRLRSVLNRFVDLAKLAVAHVCFYWEYRQGLWNSLVDLAPGFADPDRRECEIRLSRRAKYPRAAITQTGAWEIDLPECCVVCGEASDEGRTTIVREAPNLLRPLAALLLGIGLGVVWAYWSGDYWPLAAVPLAMMAVGPARLKSQQARLQATYCGVHAEARTLPALRVLGGRIIVTTGNRRVRRDFLEENGLSEASANESLPALEIAAPVDRPKTITAAAIIWLIFGSLQAVGCVLLLAMACILFPALLAGLGAGGGRVAGAGIGMALLLFLPAGLQAQFAWAFIKTGKLALSGDLASPLLNGVASLLMGSLVAWAGIYIGFDRYDKLPGADQEVAQALLQIWIVSVGVSATILILPGVLAIAGHRAYARWTQWNNQGRGHAELAALALGARYRFTGSIDDNAPRQRQPRRVRPLT